MTLSTENAERFAASFLSNAVLAVDTYSAAQDAVTKAKAGLLGNLEAHFVAFLAARPASTPREASNAIVDARPDAKSGTVATYRSVIGKALKDSALLASIRAPFSGAFLSQADAPAFDAVVAEQTARLHEAVTAIIDERRAGSKEKAEGVTENAPAPAAAPVAPAAETVQDVLARIMADLDTLSAEAAIGNLEAFAAFNVIEGRFAALRDAPATKARKAA